MTEDQEYETSANVVELLQRADKLLGESEFVLSETLSGNDTESVITYLGHLLGVSLPLLATLTNITAIADAVVSIKLPHIHSSSFVESSKHSSESPVIDTLVSQQCQVLSHIRAVRQEAEVFLTQLWQAEYLLQQSIGDCNFLAVSHNHLRILQELRQLFDSSIGVQLTVLSSSHEDIDPQNVSPTASKLLSNVGELRDAWLSLEPTWSGLLQQKYSLADFNKQSALFAGGVNPLSSGQEDATDKKEGTNILSEQSSIRQELSTEYSSGITENDDFASRDKSKDQTEFNQVMEVFVATVRRDMTTANGKDGSQEEAGILSLRKEQQQRKAVTKSLIHELQQSLIHRDHFESKEVDEPFKFFQEKKPLQRIRDFDSCTVREERVDIPLLVEMTTASNADEEDNDEEARKKDMESIQQGAQFATEKYLVRNELKNILGAISLPQQYCLGDGDSSEDDSGD